MRTCKRREEINLKLKNCEIKEKSMAEIIVEVSPEEMDSAIGEAYKKNRNSISVPGFRRGKAPRKIIERMYGVSIFYNDAIDAVVPSVLVFAQEESKLKIVSFPKVTDVDMKEDDAEIGAEITVTAAVYPEITLGQYKGLSAPKPPVTVEEADIDVEVESIRIRNSSIETVDRPAIIGDIAVIDFEGFVDGEPFDNGKGENHELVIGSSSFIPGFEDQLIGMEAGQERDVNVVFPAAYAANLAGKPAVFKVKLNEVKERILPELDDEFAKDVSEFDTLAEYRQSIRERFLEVRQKQSDDYFSNALLEKVIGDIQAEIPEPMVEERMKALITDFTTQISAYGMEPEEYLKMANTTTEEFVEKMRIQSENQIKIMLALDKIAGIEGIEISPEDIENEYKEASERFDKDVDKAKEAIAEEAIVSELKMRRAEKLITESATVEDMPVAEPPDAEPSDGTSPEIPAPDPNEPAGTIAAEEEQKDKTVGETSAEADTEKPAAKPKKPPAKKAAAKAPKEEASVDTDPEKPEKPAAKPKRAPAKKAAEKEPEDKADKKKEDKDKGAEQI